jgi:hypothetical protein
MAMSDLYKNYAWTTLTYTQVKKDWNDNKALYLTKEYATGIYISNSSNIYYKKETKEDAAKRIEAEKQAQAIHDDIQDVDFS